MSRTVRKDRNDKTYKEGRYLDHNVYKCKCEYCTTRRNERKERRKLESNRKFSVGDRVRIHHKHKDDFNTMTSQTVISYGWSEKVKAMLYQLDQSLGSDFQEDDLVEDTRELRRQNLKL